ncbi:nucleotidyltransferase family protein [Rufibacter hautae]|uniref:Nucleotidyltransferase family protein n=1 Tax=Rufibacter hautae TaxID=2595005 RepID=A0A5B6TCN1_9BACT|nr:nucleotidyltransferase family protein [Rufibacter hautae]KAA3438219.1 nucleotidyltransferase family protein [Rufibacter hautae]
MTGIIVLAAGSSSRLGQPKQQLLYKGQTLLQHSLQAALASGGSPVMVVLGANAEAILSKIEETETIVLHNPHWEEGMASSIRVGISKLLEVAPESTSALFLLCDQPFVSADLLNQMIQQKEETQKGIVACAYQNTLGAPVLFDQHFFPRLQQLKGQEGAKKLLGQFPAEVSPVPFPAGAVDIDTLADYASLKAGEVQ